MWHHHSLPKSGDMRKRWLVFQKSFSIGIVVPVPKSGDIKVASSFHFQNQEIWEGEEVFFSQSFRIGIVVPVPKSGDVLVPKSGDSKVASLFRSPN